MIQSIHKIIVKCNCFIVKESEYDIVKSNIDKIAEGFLYVPRNDLHKVYLAPFLGCKAELIVDCYYYETAQTFEEKIIHDLKKAGVVYIK